MKMKNTIFIILIFSLIFLSLEIICSIFFIYNSNYHGTLAKVFIGSTKSVETKNIKGIKFNKLTNKMQPGTYFIGNVKYKINSKGFRGEEFETNNTKNCRIISFGGSITLGLNKAYPKILGEKIKNSGINCDSLNFGMTAKSLNYIENLLISEAINYTPNIITIMTNRNATMYDSYGSSSVAPEVIVNNFDYYIYKINKYLFSNIMTYRFIDLSHRRIISWFYSDQNKILNPYNPKAFHLKNYFTSKYMNQIDNIVNFSKKNNIKVVLIKEAYYINPAYQKKINLLSKKQILEKLLVYNKQKNKNKDKEKMFWIYTNAILNKALDEVKIKNPDIILVDPTNELYKQEKKINFTDDGSHLTDSGHQIVANQIFELVVDYLKY
jgi:hypothetical protein